MQAAHWRVDTAAYLHMHAHVQPAAPVVAGSSWLSAPAANAMHAAACRHPQDQIAQQDLQQEERQRAAQHAEMRSLLDKQMVEVAAKRCAAAASPAPAWPPACAPHLPEH